MSSREGDDDRDTLGDTPQRTTLSDKNEASSGEGLNNNTKSPQQEETTITDGYRDRSPTTASPQGSTTGNITFADISAATETDEGSTEPTLTRRKSSMFTTGRRLSRIASTEKHVTILDEPSADSDFANQPKEADTTEDKGKDDEDSKIELAKILMQFDPLVEAKATEDLADNTQETVTETVLSRGMPEAALSPDLSLSSASSPRTPQQMDSPRTTHDVEVAMAEKARPSLFSSSTSKKKSESRHKSPLSPDTSTSGNYDRGTVGSSSSRSEPSKPKDIPFDFHKFLEQMRHRSAIPITRYFQSFLKEFDKKPWTVNEQIKIIHDFLEFITGKMEMCDLWRNISDQEFENVKEGMEKLVMNRLFAYTFSPSTTDDAERDEVLTQKIRIFRWIRPEHLDIPDNPHNAAYLDKAQAELKKINSYKAPRDKVICILNCCKFIFTLIRRSEGNSKGADTFLPILIYVVLQSNPPNLVSNVQYISRFRNPEKLQAEAGYYLASLDGAISFIENLEASSLSISPEEFDSQIEKTMTELSQEKADVLAAAEAAKSPATAAASEAGYQGHRKQDSKLNTLLAGTAATRASRSRPPINEKQFQSPEAAQLQEKTPSLSQHHSSRAGPDSSSPLNYTRISPMPSIRNPAAALIERGANFATKTIQKPLDIIEKMFQDNGDEEAMAKPYPPRPTQEQYQQQQQYYNVGALPVLPQRPGHAQQGNQQRPGILEREDSFAEFVYVPAGQTVQEVSPQQPTRYYQQQQDGEYPGNVPNARQRTVSGTQQQLQQPPPQHPQQQQQQQQQQSTEEYLQALETLTDMFPSCERQVCDVILQANEGRLSPSIDTLLEISSASENSNNNQTRNNNNTIEQPESNKEV